MSLIKALLGPLVNWVLAIGAAASSAALLAYLRTQSADGFKWILDPIARLLPWHRTKPEGFSPLQSLSSELTIADLFLLTRDGAHAIYAKTADYVVGPERLNSYFEGVTGAENVTGFSTELGVITQTTSEHGFFISRIDLGSVFESGTQFRNVYRAQLDNCFTSRDEHWTQEIAVPTKHLTLRVNFPPERPPELVRCKRLSGLTEYQIRTDATISRLFGHPAVIWEIPEPALGDIYKLEWRW
jgi:hypothetical protein